MGVYCSTRFKRKVHFTRNVHQKEPTAMNTKSYTKDHGITPINWTTVAAELQRDWRLPTGKDLGRVFHDHYHSYGLLMDSFEYKTANVLQKAS
jgi:hypothetical protein